MYVVYNGSNNKNRIADLNRHLDDMSKYIGLYNSEIDNAATFWVGADYDQFRAKTSDLVYSLKKLVEALETYVNFIQNYDLAQENFENYYSEKKISLE